MSGTIVVGKNIFFDVRTVDFVRIVDVLRSFAACSDTAAKLLVTVDEFGMNMICADELTPAEFKNFAQLMRAICIVLADEENGVVNLLEMVCSVINEDERLAD